MLFPKTAVVLGTTLFGRGALAVALAAPAPLITPAPKLEERTVVSIIGYISTGTARGTILWDTVTQNDVTKTITSSGSLYRICGAVAASLCPFFTCNALGYVVYPTTNSAYPSSSSYCGNGASKTCSSWVLATDIYDTSPLTNYWCDTGTGGTIYQVTPNGVVSTTGPINTPVVRSTSTTPSATDPFTSTSASVPASSASTTVVPTPPKSTPIGPIVGGVIGGLAVLGAIIVAVIFLLKRKKNTTPPPATQQYPQYHQQPPPLGSPQVQQMAPAQYYNPAQTYPPPEKSPAVVGHQVNPYYADPAMGNSPTSPVPQYSPAPYQAGREINELPAQRN